MPEDDAVTAEDRYLDIERRTLSVADAGKALGLGRSAAYNAAKSGELPTLRIGRRVLVPKAALDQMIEEALRKRERGHAA
jgi:excisionase family DNA binding protein